MKFLIGIFFIILTTFILGIKFPLILGFFYLITFLFAVVLNGIKSYHAYGVTGINWTAFIFLFSLAVIIFLGLWHA